MERFAINIQKKGIEHIYDNTPKHSWREEVCTMYSETSAISPEELTASLNMAHELRILPTKATRKQMVEIIKKYS